MGVTSDNIQELIEKEKQIKGMGGEKALAKRKDQGKLNARERDLIFCLTRALSENLICLLLTDAPILAWKILKSLPMEL